MFNEVEEFCGAKNHCGLRNESARELDQIHSVPGSIKKQAEKHLVCSGGQ